jgi:hypothetical protein
MRPYSGPHYASNEAKCKDGETPCAHCGRGVRDPWSCAVQVVEGGARYATQDEVEGRTTVPEASDLGCWPVGDACATRLAKAGVYVFAWKGKGS